MGQHKCENCGRVVSWESRKERGKNAFGWIGTGGESKYGKEFDRRGLRWWCRDDLCRKAKLVADVNHIFPDAPQHVKDFLMAEMQLELVRRN